MTNVNPFRSQDEPKGDEKPVPALLVVPLVVFGVVAGFAPVFFYLEVPLLLIGVGLVAGGMSWWLLRKRRIVPGGAVPNRQEVLVAAVSALAPAATLAFSLLIWYLLAYGGWVAVQWVMNRFEVPVFDPSPVAFYTTLAFAVLIVLGTVTLTVDELASQLFPDVAGVKSAFFVLVAEKGWWLLINRLLATGVFALLYPLLYDNPQVWYLILQIFLVFVSVTVSPPSGREVTQPNEAEAAHALAKVLKASGYRLTAEPRLDNPDVDPLLLGVDFLAEKDGRVLVIEMVMQRPNDPELKWDAARRVHTAAFALRHTPPSAGQMAKRFEPVLVYFGVDPEPDLGKLRQEYPVHVVVITDADFVKKTKTSDQTELRNLAQQYFGLVLDNSGKGASPAVLPGV